MSKEIKTVELSGATEANKLRFDLSKIQDAFDDTKELINIFQNQNAIAMSEINKNLEVAENTYASIECINNITDEKLVEENYIQVQLQLMQDALNNIRKITIPMIQNVINVAFPATEDTDTPDTPDGK